jgi:hypothetical protein
MQPAAYVVLEWLEDTPAYPRYSFATVVHAAELGTVVRWVELCATMQAAVDLVSRLNGSHRTPARQDATMCPDWPPGCTG